jgi:hypothetical protein
MNSVTGGGNNNGGNSGSGGGSSSSSSNLSAFAPLAPPGQVKLSRSKTTGPLGEGAASASNAAGTQSQQAQQQQQQQGSSGGGNMMYGRGGQGYQQQQQQQLTSPLSPTMVVSPPPLAVTSSSGGSNNSNNNNNKQAQRKSMLATIGIPPSQASAEAFQQQQQQFLNQQQQQQQQKQTAAAASTSNKLVAPTAASSSGIPLALGRSQSSVAAINASSSSSSSSSSSNTSSRRQSSVQPRRSSPSGSGQSLKLPLTPQDTLHYYKDFITPYEQREIVDYPEIYFAGAAGVEKVGTPRRRTGAEGLSPYDPHRQNLTREDENGYFNHGYDDSRGDYYLTHHDHVAYRYEIMALLGKGSFGQVAKCYDHKKKCNVALKIIRNKKRFEKQGVVEVKVLDKLRREDAENIYNAVHMQDYFYFRGHLCITFELLGVNLYEWVKAGGFRGVQLPIIKRFGWQILECMVLLYKNRIVHCDLKPEVSVETNK